MSRLPSLASVALLVVLIVVLRHRTARAAMTGDADEPARRGR